MATLTKAPMLPVPHVSELEWLNGDRLDVVCTAEFTIWFSFDSKGVIQSHDAVELVEEYGSSEFYDPSKRKGNWPFYKIIGSRVLEVIRPDDWKIEIVFDNNLRLVTRSQDGPYESGRVAVPGRGAAGDFFF